MQQAFSEFTSLVDFLDSHKESTNLKTLFPTGEDFEEIRNTSSRMTGFSSTIRSLGAELEALRGKPYAGMSFDERYELMKMVTRREELTVYNFEKLHQWMLNGQTDLISSSTTATTLGETSRRIRTITISCSRHNDMGYPCFIRLSSSPVGEYVSSRFKQKFGNDAFVNVRFEFQRMGVPSHLYLHTELDEQDFTAYSEFEYNNYQNCRFYNLVRSLYPDYNHSNVKYYKGFKLDNSDKNTPYDCHHKIKIQQELLSFREIEKYIEKDLNIFGLKFSVLCQNLSGMHSYKYVYFCPTLSTVNSLENQVPKAITVDTVKNWAVPKDCNEELYLTEKKNKQYLRLSLFNTPTIPTVRVDNFKVEQDIGSFTDGCGYISPELANEITLSIRKYLMKHYSIQNGHCRESEQYSKDLLDTSLSNNSIQSLPDSYIPSAFQIRFMGAKGMLCVKNGLFEKEGCHMVLHKSMIKIVHNIADESDEILQKVQIVGYSCPSGNAHLTLTIIHLLNGCSDDSGVIQKKLMDSMHEKVDSALESILNRSISETVKDQVKNNDFASLGVLSVTKDKNLAFLTGSYRTNLLEMKFPLKNTRRLYGVADPYGILEEGQVYVSISSKDKSKVIKNQQIIVTKEPCLHRGDLRKVMAVDIAELSHLTDVIVFPTKSKDNRPIPNTIAGSDLDGDEYFVCWDEEIVNHCKEFEPAPCDEMIEKEAFEKYTSFEPDAFKYWIGIRMAFADYFDKEWTSDENWNSTMSALCEVLNSAIDAPKQGSILFKKEQLKRIITDFPGFPHYMNKPSGGVRKSTSIIGRMFDEMNSKISKVLGLLDINEQTVCSSTIPPLDPTFTTTTFDCQKYLWLLFFHFSKEDMLFECLKNFITFMLDAISKGQTNILLASEFLSTFWRCLAMSEQDSSAQFETFYCFLKEKITNLPENIVDRLIQVIENPQSKIFFSNGLLSNISDLISGQSSQCLNSVMDNNLCTLFKVDQDILSHFLEFILFKESMGRLKIPPSKIFYAQPSIGNIYPSAKVDFLHFLKYHEKTDIFGIDSSLLPRFNFFKLCGFGKYEKEFMETKLDKQFNTIGDHAAFYQFEKKDELRVEVVSRAHCQEYCKYLKDNEHRTLLFIMKGGYLEQMYYPLEKQFDFFQKLASNSYLVNIRKLTLPYQGITDKIIELLFENTYLRNITNLDIRENPITNNSISFLSGKLRYLSALSVTKTEINGNALATLLDLDEFPSLLKLESWDNNFSNTILQQTPPNIPHKVTNLELDRCSIDVSSFLELAPFIFSPNLTRLCLSSNKISDLGAMCIAQSESLCNLKNLHVDRNNIGDEGAMYLVSSQYLQNVSFFSIKANNFTEEGIISFVSCAMPKLQYLDLGIPRELRVLFEGCSFKYF